jgi:ABC-2 type transport system ATP-binding protein
VVRNLFSHGTTVILSTHYMDEAEALADRLAIIAGGRIVATGTVDSISGRERGSATIRFRLPRGLTVADLPSDLPQAETDRSRAVVLLTDDEIGVLHRLTGWAIDSNIALSGLTVVRLTLDDIYLRLTGATSDGAEAPMQPSAFPEQIDPVTQWAP